MSRSRNALLALLRGGALGAALLAMQIVDEWTLRGVHVDLVRVLLVLVVFGGAALVLGAELLLPRSIRGRPVLPLLLLALDLVAIGGVGTYLRVAETPQVGLAASLPFLAGYLVAILVAVTGRRAGAAALGVLAGAMLLLLGESGAVRSRSLPSDLPVAKTAAGDVSPETADGPHALGAAAARAADPDPSGPPESRDLYLMLRLLLLAVAAYECAAVTGWIDQDLRRRRTAATVDRELRARERIAGEMATFVAAAQSVASLRELGEALIQHLRRHFPTGARAVVPRGRGRADRDLGGVRPPRRQARRAAPPPPPGGAAGGWLHGARHAPRGPRLGRREPLRRDRPPADGGRRARARRRAAWAACSSSATRVATRSRWTASAPWPSSPDRRATRCATSSARATSRRGGSRCCSGRCARASSWSAATAASSSPTPRAARC